MAILVSDKLDRFQYKGNYQRQRRMLYNNKSINPPGRHNNPKVTEPENT